MRRQTLIPIDSNNLSFTRPIPGTFRMDRSCMNAIMDLLSKGRWNWPFGLFCHTHVYRQSLRVQHKERGRTLSEQIYMQR